MKDVNGRQTQLHLLLETRLGINKQTGDTEMDHTMMIRLMIRDTWTL